MEKKKYLENRLLRAVATGVTVGILGYCLFLGFDSAIERIAFPPGESYTWTSTSEAERDYLKNIKSIQYKECIWPWDEPRLDSDNDKRGGMKKWQKMKNIIE